MKRFVILSLFIAFSSIVSISAQEEDPWVGEWTSESYSDIDWDASNATKDAYGTIQTIHYADYRLIIRINKNGDHYSARAKNIMVGNSDYSHYYPTLTVTRVSDNKMYLQAFLSKQPYRSNGEIEEWYDITYYYTLTLENGGLHFEFIKYHSVNYDRNMRYKDENDWNVRERGDDLMLYNDNW